jgi:hypothetical protein
LSVCTAGTDSSGARNRRHMRGSMQGPDVMNNNASNTAAPKLHSNACFTPSFVLFGFSRFPPFSPHFSSFLPRQSDFDWKNLGEKERKVVEIAIRAAQIFLPVSSHCYRFLPISSCNLPVVEQDFLRISPAFSAFLLGEIGRNTAPPYWAQVQRGTLLFCTSHSISSHSIIGCRIRCQVCSSLGKKKDAPYTYYRGRLARLRR